MFRPPYASRRAYLLFALVLALLSLASIAGAQSNPMPIVIPDASATGGVGIAVPYP
jgi:hypothetical protein